MEKRRNDPSGIRMRHIQKMHDMIQGGGEIQLSRFLALCSYQMGLTRKTSLSYLADLQDLGFCEILPTEDLLREVKKEATA